MSLTTNYNYSDTFIQYLQIIWSYRLTLITTLLLLAIFPFTSESVRQFAVYTENPFQLSSYVTAAVTHTSFRHLASNLVGILVFGAITEYSLDKKFTLATFVLLLLSGPIGFVVLHFAQVGIVRPAYLVGASGLTYGLFGAICIFLYSQSPTNLFKISPLFCLGGLIASQVWRISNPILVNGHPVAHKAHLASILFGICVGILIILKGELQYIAS